MLWIQQYLCRFFTAGLLGTALEDDKEVVLTCSPDARMVGCSEAEK